LSPNQKIAALAAMKPWAEIYAAFSLAARLAAEAIEATEELQQLPGTSGRALQPTQCRSKSSTPAAAKMLQK